MNHNINSRVLLSLAALLLLTGNNSLSAQQKIKKEKESIVITPKGDKKEKVTIIVDGDRITVNGTPIKDYHGDQLIIRHGDPGEPGELAFVGEIPDFDIAPEIMVSPEFHFPEAFNLAITKEPFAEAFPEPFEKGALLGVVTEKVSNGVKIKEVMKESSAEKAGLKEGDIITMVDGKKVSDPDQLADIIGDKDPNEEVEITYLRNNKTAKVKVKLGERKMNFAHSYKFRTPKPGGDMRQPYMHLAPLMRDYNFNFNDNWRERQRLGLRVQEMEDSSGVKVLEVEEESIAAKAGVKRDDVITEINGEKVKDLPGTRDAMRKAAEKSSYQLKVNRSGTTVTLEVKFPKMLKKADL